MAVSILAQPAGEFDSFVRARTAPLLRAAYVLTGDQHLAEDLVQDALARTHRAWPKLHATGAADAYTRKIMYHLQVSWWRRRRVAEALTGALPARPASGAALADAAAMQVTLRSVLLRLPPRQRAVLVLRFFDDLTEAQTAEAMDISVGTVKSQTAKALAKLRVLAPDLREFYAGTAEQARPVDLRERALASSRQLAVRRNAAVSAAVALVAVLAVALAVLGVGRDRTPPPAEPSPAPSPTEMRAYAEDAAPDLGPFRDVSITVPAWAGSAASRCQSGRVRLNESGSSEYTGTLLPVWVSAYTETDVDADGDGDLVAVLHCGEGPEAPGTEVVAFRRDAAGRPVTMARIVGTRDGFGAIYQVIWAEGGVTVELSKDYTDGGQETVPFQNRTYRLVGGVAQQFMGPPEFEANPRYAALTVGASDLALRPAAAGAHAGRLTVTVANDGTAGVRNGELRMSFQGDWLRPAGTGWDWCTRHDHTVPDHGYMVRCSGIELDPGQRREYTFEFVADTLPAQLNPSPESAWQNTYEAMIGQLPPYTYEREYPSTSPFSVVLASS